MSVVGSSVRDDIHTLMKSIMIKEGVSEYVSEISGSSEKGDGYLGDITFVKVIGKDSTDKLKEFNYVIKSGKDNEELRKQVPIHEVYENEIYFYEVIFPTFRKFQLDMNVDKPFNNVPRFAGELTYKGIEIIVLDNLKKIGFELYDRKKALNLEHLESTFRLYGKFHAISFALREHNPGLFKKLHSKLTDGLKDMVEKAQLMDSITPVLERNQSLFEKEPEVKNVLQKLKEQARFVMVDLLDPKDPCNVILHGDCWNNNFMFQYKGTNRRKPVDVCFLDWQLSKLASPVYDLSYHLYVCASKQELDHFNELLHIYHESFSSFLKQFNCDPEKLFPFKKLIDHWKKYSKYGLIFGIWVLQFVLCDSDEAPELTDVNKDANFAAMLSFDLKDKTIYEQRVKDVMRHYVKEIL